MESMGPGIVWYGTVVNGINQITQSIDNRCLFQAQGVGGLGHNLVPGIGKRLQTGLAEMVSLRRPVGRFEHDNGSRARW